MKWLLVVRSRSLLRLLRLGLGAPDRGSDRSCQAPPFRTAREVSSRFSLSSALSFFGPSLGTPFCSCVPQSLLWPLLTSPRLSTRGSPRVSAWSFRSCLWALQNVISDSLGFACASLLAPDILPHCPFVFLRSSVCFPPFRAGSLRRRPGGSATVGVTSPRREPFIPIDPTPAGHTSAPVPGRRASKASGVSAKIQRVGAGGACCARGRAHSAKHVPARR